MPSLIYPCSGARLTSPFGYRTHPVTGAKQSFHKGIDLAKAGTVDIVASAAGTVRYAQEMGTYGYVVIIRHSIAGQRMDTTYAHLRKGSITVKVGQTVKQGQKIGLMGNTGRSTGQHLHYEVHKGEWKSGQPNAVDPLIYLGKTVAASSKPSSKATGTSTQAVSLVDYLEKAGKDSSLAARKKLAAANGIANYTGTATQNTKLLGILQGGASGGYYVTTGTVKTQAALTPIEKVIRKQYPSITLTPTKKGSLWCFKTGTFKAKKDAEAFVTFFKGKGYLATLHSK